MNNLPPACPTPCSSHSKQHRKETPMHTNLWLLGIFPVIQPRAKAAGPSSASQYLRQDKPAFCYSRSGRSANTHRKQLCYFWWAAAALEGGPFHPAQHGSLLVREPVARTSLFHGSGASTRLLLSSTLPMQRKLAFWRLRIGVETILKFLKSPMGVNYFVCAELNVQGQSSTLKSVHPKSLWLSTKTWGWCYPVYQQYTTLSSTA